MAATALTACSGEGIGDKRDARILAARHAQAVAEETEKLNAWFAEKWTEELDFAPLQKTYLGIKDADQSKLDPMTESAADKYLAWREATVAEMKERFDYDTLTPDAQLSYDIYAAQVERAARAAAFRRRAYVFHQMRGPHTNLPNFMINFHKVETVEDMDAYAARIEALGRALSEALDRAQLAAAEGVHAPRFAYEGVISQSEAIITGAPFTGEGDSPLMADARAKADALVDSGAMSAADAAAMKDRVASALVDTVKPAYEAIITWAKADMSNSPAVATGVHILPEGDAFYAERLAFSTTTDMSADAIHELGLSEVARIRGEMEAIKDQVGFDGTLEEFFTFMREDDQFFYPNTDEGREAYLEAARDALAFIKERLPDYFGILPKADLIVKRVEPFRERDGGAQHYFAGTPDGSRPGIYYNHLSDMRAMPIPQIEVIAYHEGNPGHHLQNSIRQEVDGLPAFRGQASFTAYGEGWALYSELLAKEMGAFEDPYSDFGRLTTEIWRAIRLVVDTGLHHKGWSEQEAIDYFTANSPAAAGQIKSEVQRYIVMPGQATSYKVGMLKILELRENAKKQLGAAFDIREFHDIVVGGGAMPLSLLEARVERWVNDKKAAA